MTTTGLRVKHNIEVAHRLSLLPGKCEAIHGHSMWVTLTLNGLVNPVTGILGDLDFGSVKWEFRQHLDETYDHHLLLNEDDEWAHRNSVTGAELPGLVRCKGDPTTENIARWIGEHFQGLYASADELTSLCVEVEETRVNTAFWQGEFR